MLEGSNVFTVEGSGTDQDALVDEIGQEIEQGVQFSNDDIGRMFLDRKKSINQMN